MTVAALHASNLRGTISGGARSMDALVRRLGGADGDLTLEMYQLASRPVVDALLRHAERGGAIRVLGDARLPAGGFGEQIERATSGGAWREYGRTGASWQHAKSYHLDGPDGPESWITNLAPIPDSLLRTELSVIVAGDAALAARAAANAAIDGHVTGIQAAIDAAAGHGVLINDPVASRMRLTEGITELIEEPAGDLLVITKGLQHEAITRALVAAHDRGRDVRILVRDLAAADGEQLARAGVPTWIVGGGLKPRVNGIFSADRGIVGSAFLWDNMLGTAEVAGSRDAGVLLAGPTVNPVRDAALGAATALPSHMPVADALSARLLPHRI